MAVPPLVAWILAVFQAMPSFALTVRSRSDVRLWETVTDRSCDLSWPWEAAADEARLTFSNCLTHAVSSEIVAREPGGMRGSCPHPVSPAAEEALVAATVSQLSGGVEIARETAELAYVPGVGVEGHDGEGVVVTSAITVRAKADSEWGRVRQPRLAAYDAKWWDVTGPSGYEVLWAEPAGPHDVVREFAGVGIVDETVLRFGMPGLLMLLR